jgi:hypothetical protein
VFFPEWKLRSGCRIIFRHLTIPLGFVVRKQGALGLSYGIILSKAGAIEGLDMPAAHGTRDMPIWGDVFIGEAVGSSVTINAAKKATSDVEQRISRLVKYLESIQTKK